MKKVVALLSLGLYGCSSMVQTSLQEESVAHPPSQVDYIKIENPVEEYPVRGLILRDDLNHNIPYEHEIRIQVSEREPLSEVLRRIEGVPVVASGFVGDITAPAGAVIEGKVGEVLDKLASLYGVYWTYDEGAVRFVYEKTLIYTIPLIARQKLSYTYGDGSKDVKEDLFDEIEKKLVDLLNIKVAGKFVYSRGTKVKSVGKRDVEDHLSSEVVVGKEESKLLMNKESKLSSRNNTLSSKKETNLSDTREEEKVSERIRERDGESGSETPQRKGRATGDTPVQVFKDIDRNTEKETDKDKSAYTRSNGTAKTEERKSVGGEDVQKEERDSVSFTTKDTTSRGEKKTYTSDDSVERGNERGYTLVQEIEKPKSKVVVIKDAGIVAVRVTREEEPLVRSLMKSLIENRLSTMVVIQAVVVETSEEVLRELRVGVNLSKTSRIDTKDITFSLGAGQLEGGLQFGLVGATETLNSIINFAIVNGKGRILSSPQVMTLSGMPATIKSAIDYPYLEPQTTSLQTGTAQLSYSIKSVTDGIEMNITPYAMGDSVIMTFGLNADKYLGDKSMQAGALGTVDLPIRAPREVLTSLRLKAGQGILIAGVRSEVMEKRGGESTLVDTDSRYYKRLEGRDLFIVLVPKIVRFTEKEE